MFGILLHSFSKFADTQVEEGNLYVEKKLSDHPSQLRKNYDCLLVPIETARNFCGCTKIGARQFQADNRLLTYPLNYQPLQTQLLSNHFYPLSAPPESAIRYCSNLEAAPCCHW